MLIQQPMKKKQPSKMKEGSAFLMWTRWYQHPVMLPGHKAWRVEGMHWGHVTGYSWQGLWWGAWPHPVDKEVTERWKQGVNRSALHFIFFLFLFFWADCIYFIYFFFMLYNHFIIFFVCGGFCHTLKWNSHWFTCVPHPDTPSHLPLESELL